MAYWYNFPNEPAFTNGIDRWALTEAGLQHWTGGDAFDPSPAGLVPDANAISQGVVLCPLGQSPAFTEGFAGLRERLGDRMGDAATCERYMPNGDSIQFTTEGMLYYLARSNTPTFTQADVHFALTPAGFVQWQAHQVEPPANAQVVGPNTKLLDKPTTDWVGFPPAPHVDPLPYLGGAVTLHTKGQPDWVEGPLHLLWGYDKVNGTVLVPTLQKVRIDAMPLPDGVGGYTEPGHIVINSQVARSESDYVIAAVLAHEATHARDLAQNMKDTQASCFTTEISAYQMQARVWEAFYGTQGDLRVATDWEKDMNANLHDWLTSPGARINAITSSDTYQAECLPKQP